MWLHLLCMVNFSWLQNRCFHLWGGSMGDEQLCVWLFGLYKIVWEMDSWVSDCSESYRIVWEMGSWVSDCSESYNTVWEMGSCVSDCPESYRKVQKTASCVSDCSESYKNASSLRYRQLGRKSAFGLAVYDRTVSSAWSVPLSVREISIPAQARC